MSITPAPTRRSFATSTAWAIPAVALASAAPASAASSQYTSTNDEAFAYFNAQISSGTGCSASNPNSGGHISTQSCTGAGGPVSATGQLASDCSLDPDGANGFGIWIETSNATSGTAAIGGVTAVYTFGAPIALDAAPNGNYNTTGTYTWTAGSQANGWNASLSSDGLTLTMTYPGLAQVMTSTSEAGSGTALPGFFQNFHYTGVCPGRQSIRATTTFTWYDAEYPDGIAFSKTNTMTLNG